MTSATHHLQLPIGTAIGSYSCLVAEVTHIIQQGLHDLRALPLYQHFTLIVGASQLQSHEAYPHVTHTGVIVFVLQYA